LASVTGRSGLVETVKQDGGFFMEFDRAPVGFKLAGSR
jgi:hypothetical protein